MDIELLIEVIGCACDPPDLAGEVIIALFISDNIGVGILLKQYGWGLRSDRFRDIELVVLILADTELHADRFNDLSDGL